MTTKSPHMLRARLNAATQTGVGAWLQQFGITRATALTNNQARTHLRLMFGAYMTPTVCAYSRCTKKCKALHAGTPPEKIDWEAHKLGIHWLGCYASGLRLKRHNQTLRAWEPS